MTVTEALGILELPKKPGKEAIEASYKTHQEFYYPPMYDLGIGGQAWAYGHYQQGLEAYKLLTSADYKKTGGADLATTYGHDVYHYGPVVARVRDIVAKLSKHWLKAFIAMLASALIGFMFFRDNIELASGITKAFGIAACVLWLGAPLSAPLDTLSYLPGRIFEGLRVGFASGPVILRPITAVLFALFWTISGAFKLIFCPYEVHYEREFRYIAQQKKRAPKTDPQQQVAADLEAQKQGVLGQRYLLAKNAYAYYLSCGADAASILRQYKSQVLATKPFFQKTYAAAEKAYWEAYDKLEHLHDLTGTANSEAADRADRYVRRASFYSFTSEELNDEVESALKRQREEEAEWAGIVARQEERHREAKNLYSMINGRVELEAMISMYKAQHNA